MDNCFINVCIVGGVWGGEGVDLKFMFSQWWCMGGDNCVINMCIVGGVWGGEGLT